MIYPVTTDDVQEILEYPWSRPRWISSVPAIAGGIFRECRGPGHGDKGIDVTGTASFSRRGASAGLSIRQSSHHSQWQIRSLMHMPRGVPPLPSLHRITKRKRSLQNDRYATFSHGTVPVAAE